MSHYIKLFYRNINRDRGIFALNFLGLSAGFACAILISLWAFDETGVDKFHDKNDRLFEVMKNTPIGANEIRTSEDTPGPLAEVLAADFPEVEQAVSVYPWMQEKGYLTWNDIHIKAREIYAGKQFFTVFTYPLVAGKPENAISGMHSVVISEGLATSLFKNPLDALGKSVDWNQGEFAGSYQVTGVFKSIPTNSTMQFDIVFAFDLFRQKQMWVEDWTNGACMTYVVLKNARDEAAFSNKINGLLQQNGRNAVEQLFVRKYSDRYLYDKYENGIQVGGRIQYVELFGVIALFILIIASINFVNLSTARASRRLKEVGLRKTVGATRRSLIFQFIGESLTVTFVSVMIGVIIASLILPQFNNVTGKNLTLNFSLDVFVLIAFIVVVTGVAAGSYPALHFSGFKAVVAFRGEDNTRRSSAYLRKGLVIFQFSTSVVLIIAVIVVYKQINLVQQKPLGYEKDNLVLINKDQIQESRTEAFIQGVKQISGVVNASTIIGNMTSAASYTNGIGWDGKAADELITFASIQGSYDFIETLGIKLKEGRTYSREFPSDSLSGIVVNEAAVEVMKLKNPIGATFVLFPGRLSEERRQIVGVVKNFHFESLYEQVKPCFFRLVPGENVVVRIEEGREREVMASLETLYKNYSPGYPFEYRFLDNDFQSLYSSEFRVGILSQYFAGMAILIACLGLYALATYTVERKKKEISIRKIFGSSNEQIARILATEFMQIVVISIIVAIPVSYYTMKTWLDDFAYKVSLDWSIFVIGAVSTLIIASFAIIHQTVRASILNPSESLKND